MTSRTLFVADIPSGLSEAEFAALFQSGFEDRFVAARLRRDRNDNIVGFIDYVDHAAAEEARARWEGYKVNPTDERGLTIHFSHSSSRPRRTPQPQDSLLSYPPGDEGGHDEAPHDEAGQEGAMVSSFGEDGSLYGGGGMMLTAGGYGNTSSFSPSLFLQQPFQPSNSHPMAHMAMQHPHMGKEQGMAMSQGVHNAPLSRQHMQFPSLPNDASPTLYIEGLPLDATEREVSHIFRHYAGYLSVRILPKESKHPGRSYNLCFVEFENRIQSSYAMHALQGYKMTPMDPNGLHISYAKSERRMRRRV